MGLPKGRTNNPNGRPPLSRSEQQRARLNCMMPAKLFAALTYFAKEEEISLPAACRKIISAQLLDD